MTTAVLIVLIVLAGIGVLILLGVVSKFLHDEFEREKDRQNDIW